MPKLRVPSHGFPVAAVVSLLRLPLGAGGMAVRRALLALRPHGAFLPASASRHRLTCPRAVAAVSGDAGWARRVCRARRCGESGESGKRGCARVCVCVSSFPLPGARGGFISVVAGAVFCLKLL